MESWTRQDQKLLEAVTRGDVARVAALAARRAARPAKLNARGQSAYVTPGGDTGVSWWLRGGQQVSRPPLAPPGSTWLRPRVSPSA